MSNQVTETELQEFNNENVKRYTNGDITVYWRPGKCIHSANCIIGLPAVFNSQKRPWINMTDANTDEVIKTVDSCPSRALLYKNNKGAAAPDKAKDPPTAGSTRVQILKNGPALISGDFIIRDADNQQIGIETEIAAICRCGASKKKPFCDGNHTRIGFKD
ncbi:MAG: (4Fe-4S)-binding protein [Bacteroidales bacterium]|nr:(4Fe-4S)-binding protein [Bacteroidales bacterium]